MSPLLTSDDTDVTTVCYHGAEAPNCVTVTETVLTEEIDAVVFSTPHSEYEDNAELQRRLHALPECIVVHDAWGVLSDGARRPPSRTNALYGG